MWLFRDSPPAITCSVCRGAGRITAKKWRPGKGWETTTRTCHGPLPLPLPPVRRARLHHLRAHPARL